MVRFLPLAFSLFRSRMKGMVALASRNRKHAVLRMDIARGVLGKRQLSHQSHIEALEPRHLMAANPVAYDDAAFYTNVSTDLVVTTSSSPAHLLANDLDIDGGAITSSVVVGPTSGSLVAFGTNGTFTYRPNTGFSGIDSFTYKINDGSLDSNVAKVTIAVGQRLLAKQNPDSNVFGSPQGAGSGIGGADITTGDLVFSESVTPTETLIYRGDSLIKPIITVETQLAPGVAVPTAITAQLTFNGATGTTYSYSTSGMASQQAMLFAIQADGSALATGMYDYTLNVSTTVGGVTSTQAFTGKQAIVNRSGSEYGSGWWLDGLDRVVDSSTGALVVRGNGSTLWFPKTGFTYQRAAGDTDFNTLVKTGSNTYTLTSKTGIVSNFSTIGLLTSVVDTNSNTTSFTYADRNSDGIANELISITDPFSRVTNINYTSGKVSSIAHYSGRTTTLSISSGNLTSYTLTDPDGAGALAAPVFAFGYTSGRLTSSTDAVSNVTSYSYNTNDGRLRTITRPDTKTWQLIPIETIALPTTTTGNTLRVPVSAQASVTDERGNIWKSRTDRFGLVTESITALGFVTTIRRDGNGLPVVMVQPDPDGTGPLSSSVSYLGYNNLGSLTHSVAPNGGVTTATYSTALSRLLSSTDPVGRTTSSTYDSAGNKLTQVDGAGFTTTFVVNSRGLPTSITQPDPDGAGSLVAPITAIAYDSMGRATTITNPDSSTQTFTYNSANQVLTQVDELGRTVTYVFDSLGRQTSVTNRVSATTSFAYDSLSRLIKQTDPLGNVTDTEYNNRGWVSKVTYPDPDGAGSLTRPVENRYYDAAGNQTAEPDPDTNFTTAAPYVYDADNRLITRGTSVSPTVPPSNPTAVVYSSSQNEQLKYDNMGRLIEIQQVSSGANGTAREFTKYSYDASERLTRKSSEFEVEVGEPTVLVFEQLFGYSLAGELISQTDGRGNTRTRTYNSRGLVATDTLPDADGTGSQFPLAISYGYDNLGRQTSEDRGFGRITTMEYNNRSWLTKVTQPDPDGAGSQTSPVTQFGYNTRGDKTTTTDPLGRVTTTAFDNEQRPTSVTLADPDGAGSLTSPVLSTSYDAANWITSKTDARGGVTTFTYDNLGRLLTQTDPDPDGAGSQVAAVTTNTYNASGLWKVTDALSGVTTFTRDDSGRTTSVTDGLGNVTSYEYDFYGNLTKQIDPDPDGAGALTRPVTTFTYDMVNRRISKKDPRNGTTSYTYDLANNLTSLKDPVNNTTNFAYDNLNRQVLNTNSLSKSKSYVFDVAGNLTQTTDRNGRVIQYSYDTLDRQTTESWQQSSVKPSLVIATTQEGGTQGEVQSVGWTTTDFYIDGTFTLSLGGQTTSALAANASAATIQTALEGLSTIGTGNVLVTVANSSSPNRTIGLTFRNGKFGVNMAQATINVSNLWNEGMTTGFNNTVSNGGTNSEVQTVTLSNATGGSWRLAYNGEITAPLLPSITAAQLKMALDAFVGIDNVTITGSSGSFTITYGGNQASTSMSQLFGDAANATNGSSTRTITTAYNASSEITSLSDPSATIATTRDNLGRATTIVNTINGLTPTVTLNQAFDSANNRTELKGTIGSTNDFRNTYTYDAMQRLTEIVQQGQSGGNAVTSKRVTQSFNVMNQRTNIARFQSTGTTNPVATTDFAYDTINRLSTLTHKQGSTTFTGYTYGYDGMSRPTSVNSTIEGVSLYSYDATSQVTGADHSTQTDETYGYDLNGNRNTSGYTIASNNRTTAGQGFTYTYDDEGNRLTRTETSTGKVQSYDWDYRNRLVSVKDRNTSGGSIVKQVNHEYDAINRMVRRELDADGAGSGAATNQYWIYDEGINAILQFEGAAASTLSHRYLWSNQVDELFADEQVTSLSTGGNTLWGLADHLGSLRDIADMNESTGVTTVTNHRTFSVTGKLISESNAAVDMLFAFTGKQLDEATGLQQNLNRWYDPGLGQWISEDPIGFEAGDENIRRYVKNGVIGRRDPDGLQEQDPPNVTPIRPVRCTGEWPNDAMILPLDPSGLPDDWVIDPSHRHPYGTRLRHPSGDWLDYHEPNPNNPRGRWQRIPHWHLNDGDHLAPGTEVPDPVFPIEPEVIETTAVGVTTLVILYWVISEGSRLFPPRNIVPIP